MESDVKTLKGGNCVITHNRDDALRVLSGEVLVYIAPWKDGKLGRRVFLYAAKAGETVPSLSFKDYEYTQWRFCLTAVDTAELATIRGGCTSVLRGGFARKLKLNNYGLEGFDNSLIDRYKLTVVAEDGLIHKTVQERRTTPENILRLIYNVFNKKQLTINTKRDSCPVYDAARVICGKSGIPLAPYAKIAEACTGAVSITDIARISHFVCREVVLEENWYRSDAGYLIVFDTEDRPVACVPRGQNRYTAYTVETGGVRAVDAAFAGQLSPKAYALYRPLPDKRLSAGELFRFCRRSVNRADIIQILVFTAVSMSIGLLLPAFNRLLYDRLIPIGAVSAAVQAGAVLGAVMLGNLFVVLTKNMNNLRASGRIEADTECAVIDRLFNLPMSFFRKYDSADLAGRVSAVSAVVTALVNAVLVTGLTALLSLVFLGGMIRYSPRLSWMATLILVVYGALLLIISKRAGGYAQEIQELEGRTASELYQYISGIEKIRMSGAEDRALFEHLKLCVKKTQLGTKMNSVSSLNATLKAAAGGLFPAVLCGLIAKSGTAISAGEFIAFMSAFGVFSGSFIKLFFEINSLRMLKPLYGRCKPIFEEAPEFDGAKELPGDLSGEFEISNVTFSYSAGSAAVIDKLSLRAQAGEYIGIVGPSGCGKSTLLKLLLGFETPATGKIYYDGKDLESLDKRELRRKIGVVLQEGKLISGSIFDNITVASPGATLYDAQSAVRAVGLEEEVSDMPMGIYTMLNEDGSTISGGQRQRILIAGAIIGKPGILFFDEATSALDNVTQAAVCASLEAINATRIVIAHRLSTIINCDRIIVLDGGKIVEQGTYRELMDARGLFRELASRQIS